MHFSNDFALGSSSGRLPMNGGSPAPLSETMEKVMGALFPDFCHLHVLDKDDADSLDWFDPKSHGRTLPQALSERYDDHVIARLGRRQFRKLQCWHVSRLAPVRYEGLELAAKSIRSLSFYYHALKRAGYGGDAGYMRDLLQHCGDHGVVILGESLTWQGFWQSVHGSRKPTP